MKKIAKILAMLAVFALAFSFAGCKSDDSDSSDDDVTISGGSTSGNGSSNGSSSGSNTSGGGSNSEDSSDNTSGSSSSGGNGGNTSDDTSGGNSSGGSNTGDSSSGSGSGSGSTTGGTTSGSIEPVAKNFVKIPAASIDGTENWTPSSKVFVSERKLEIASFYMSDHEVTRGEYKAVIGSDPSAASAYDKDGNELKGDDVKNNPVNNITWYDALVYCNTRSIKEKLTPCYTIDGKTDPKDWGTVSVSSDSTWNAATCDFKADGYRLPTEAEWEWAARGGKDYTTYAGSNDIDEVAWYTVNTNDTGTRDVKTKNPNGYGLYDMSGNVWEWCWDWNGDISSDTPSTGSASDSCRVRRGGCWYLDAKYAQIALREHDFPNFRSSYRGLRVVRTAK